MRKQLHTNLKNKVWIFIAFTLFISNLNAQVEVAPLSCYSQYATTQEMDAAAASGGTSPFATWKGAYDYAVANNILTINFVAGTYSTSVSGFRADWGDADGGFILLPGMTVNGNGAVIDNSPVGSSQICFATLDNNTSVNGFVFSQLSGVPDGGALYVPSSADNWTINDCDFFNCNQGTDAVTVELGPTSSGTISDCDFYGNSNPGATYPESPGAGSSSALDISGSLTSSLSITNSTFSCNHRNVSGGAIQIHDDVDVDFDGCTFYRNEASSSVGGAVSIRFGADVTFLNTDFIENFSTASSGDGGAISIESGSTVLIDGCRFTENDSEDDAGAIIISGPSTSNISFLTVQNTIFEGNTCNDDGGVIQVGNNSTTVIDGCLFKGNESGDKGGVVWVTGTGLKDLDILNCTFTENDAGSGEAIIHTGYLNTMTDVYIDNSVICDNNSSEDIESEYTTALTTVNDSYWDNDKGTLNQTGTNTTPYAPSYDANFNDSSGAGWTGTYSEAVGSGSCPSTPAPADNCSEQGSISGMVWDDSADDDGINNNSAPLSGVAVELFNCDGTTTGISAFTDADGAFYFGGLSDGDCYYLEFTPPAAFNAAPQDASGSDSTNDSDINGAYRTADITIDTSPNSVDEDDDTSSETHYVTVDAGFTMNSVPVEWERFEVVFKDCKVQVQWNTHSEINNAHFEIQKGYNGVDFQTVKEIDGNGNSISLLRYDWEDTAISSSSETAYYRIKQVDFDGNYSFSDIKSVRTESCSNTDWELLAYPTIALESVNIESNREIKVIEFFNSSGILVDKMINQSDIKEISLENLVEGIYWISIYDHKGNRKIVKLIKV